MPLRRPSSPFSLYYSCLEPALHVLAKIRVPDIFDANKEWPMDHLPKEIVSDLMEAQIVRYLRIGEPVLIYAVNYKILFTPRVRRATIFYRKADFELLAKRCTNLRQLVIVTWTKTYDLDFFRPLLEESSVLQVTIEKYQYGFIVHNNELRQSVVPSNVTCCSSPFAERLVAHKPYCMLPKLEPSMSLQERPLELYFLNISVCLRDVIFVLKSCPNIHILRCRNELEALYTLYEELSLSDTDDELCTTFKLKNMDYVNCILGGAVDQCTRFKSEKDVFEAVKVAVKLCPNISIILLRYDFDQSGGFSPILDPLMSLSLIEGLYLMGGRAKDKQLYRFLRKHGKNIKTLELSVFQRLDLDLIMSLCPNVIYMELAIGDFNIHEPVAIPFNELQNLRSLKIGRVCNTGLSPGSWNVLLKSHMLTFVQLLDVEIDPKILEEITDNKLWSNLVELCVVRCHTLEAKHVINIVGNAKHIRTLIIHLCKKIGETEAYEIDRYLLKERSNLKVLINPCP